MTNNKDNFWFPARPFGYGWDLPVAWQGWVVLILFIIISIATAIIHLKLSIKFPIFIVLIISFFIVCWLKGEKQHHG